VIGTSNSFEMQAEGGEQFELEITSNSNVGNVEFRQEEKKMPSSSKGDSPLNILPAAFHRAQNWAD
jgi:hypothetical protein